MGIFGWSYPPGAENDPFAPYNQEPEDVCPECGEYLNEDGECEECGWAPE